MRFFFILFLLLSIPAYACDSFDANLITEIHFIDIELYDKDNYEKSFVVYNGQQINILHAWIKRECGNIVFRADKSALEQLPEGCSFVFTPTGCKFLQECTNKGCGNWSPYDYDHDF